MSHNLLTSATNHWLKEIIKETPNHVITFSLPLQYIAHKWLIHSASDPLPQSCFANKLQILSFHLWKLIFLPQLGSKMAIHLDSLWLHNAEYLLAMLRTEKIKPLIVLVYTIGQNNIVVYCLFLAWEMVVFSPCAVKNIATSSPRVRKSVTIIYEIVIPPP